MLCRKFRESRGASAITQIVLPSPLRSKVLSHLHSGHLGVKRTLEKVKERFYWPSYVADVECFVRECEQCQRRNPPNPLPRAPFETIKANHPFQIVTWDIMGPLPTSETGFKYILVVTDVFTKWVEAFPLKSTVLKPWPLFLWTKWSVALVFQVSCTVTKVQISVVQSSMQCAGSLESSVQELRHITLRAMGKWNVLIVLWRACWQSGQ